MLKLERRIKNGWGGRVNYTWSSRKDNLVGESNFFSSRSSTPLNAYDLDAEYGTSLLDTPHRLNSPAPHNPPPAWPARIFISRSAGQIGVA